jgi:hypothetical protein
MNPKEKKKERKEKGICFLKFFLGFLYKFFLLVYWTPQKNKIGDGFWGCNYLFASPNCLSFFFFFVLWG